MRPRAALALAVLAAGVLAAGVLAAAPPATAPHAWIGASGDVEIVLPGSVLRDATVQNQLTSGLTTAFVTRLADGDASRGALRVEVRYELWDETYLVEVLELTGRKQNLTFHSFDQLTDWWSRTHLRLGRLTGTPATVRLKMELVPFSAGEEADAKRWLAHSIGEAAGPAAAPRAGTTAGEAKGGNILDLVIGTSMRRKPVQSWVWTVRLERR